ncbi:hypothetical protein L5515_006951 [Caenorhabditis briggsae]|uniref:C6 domain-containing protein n=1 Tax=Caenorhabditis briggsae TaxID=6238 RepID=A0AAE9JLI8_CAEBR|nr:hypothetical protein L5515_006950 [Caenorhabditis briggsae]UMM33487.1 hypothetical protein L5515_006951 [Caenorhabditis briggsae]
MDQTIEATIETCIKTIPLEEVYITSTLTEAPVTNAPVTNAPMTPTPVRVYPTNPSNSCDINKLTLPMAVAGTNFRTSDSITTGGCKQTSVTCEGTDGQNCRTVAVVGSSGSATGNLDSTTNGNTATAILTCQADGTYLSGSLSNINQVSCLYDTCSNPCVQCDINAVKQTTTLVGSTFSSVLA